MSAKWLDVMEVRRWLTLRCAHCGHRFRWKRDPRHSFGNHDGRVYHGPCMGYITWRRDAEERLEVLGIACDITRLTSQTITGLVEMRAKDEGERITQSNKVFRVFYALRKQQEADDA